MCEEIRQDRGWGCFDVVESKEKFRFLTAAEEIKEESEFASENVRVFLEGKLYGQ